MQENHPVIKITTVIIHAMVIAVFSFIIGFVLVFFLMTWGYWS